MSDQSATFELTAALLEPVLVRLLGDPSAKANSFKLLALKPGLGNPTSRGVYRVRGVAQTATGEQPFSLVVKHLADGKPFMDASVPTSWNYWRREIDLFESPIARRIPDGLGFPKYLGQSSLADGTALFWNADLGDLTKSKWTWEHCLTAARLAAELNSINIEDVASEPWLCSTMLAGWIEFRGDYFVPVAPAVVACAKSQPDTAAAYEVWGSYLDKHQLLADIVVGARSTFVHGDYNLNNLVPTANPDQPIIALDWQLAGVSGIGVDLASILNTTNELGVAEVTLERFEELCVEYTSHFNRMNPGHPVELNEVRLVVAAMGYSILNTVAFFFVRPSLDVEVDEHSEGVRNLVKQFSTGPLMTYARVLAELGV